MRSIYEEMAQIRRTQAWQVAVIIALTLAVGVLICCQAFGQDVRPTDRAIAKYMLVDLLQLDESDRPFVRYLAAPPSPRPAWVFASDYVVNTAISQSRTLQRGAVVAGGYLLRYDLRNLAFSKRAFDRLIQLWDTLATRDPYYHVSQVTAAEEIVETAEALNAAVIAPHIESIVAELATEANFSPSLVYRYDVFQDQVFQAAGTSLGRGLYYDFLQLPKPAKGQSDLQAFLASLGINYADVDATGGERRVATFTSGVTSRTRRVDTYIGAGGLRVWITQDVAEDSVQAAQHPIYSLVRFRPDAKEVIAERPNGLHVGLLFDAKGALQAVVPPDIAHDGTIPYPFPADLTPGISCLRCHAQSGHRGLKPVENDVARLLTRRLAVLDDLVGDPTGLDAAGLQDRLSALYAGQRFQTLLERGREDHQFATRQLIGDPGADDPVGLVADEVAAIWSDYRYRWIDARVAYGELAGEWIDGDASAKLAAALGQSPLEDPAIAELTTGGRLRRADWERVYTTAALRFYAPKEAPHD